MSPRSGRTAVVAVAAAVLLVACGPAVGDPDVAARVGGETITLDAVRERIVFIEASPEFQQSGADPEAVRRQTQAQALEQLVFSKILLQAAEERGVAPTAAEVESFAEQILTANFGGDEAAFEASVPEGALEVELIRRALIDLVAADVEVTEEELRAVYEQQASAPEVRHILLGSEAEAEEVLGRLAGGEEFAALAQELSLDQQSATIGGSLGPFPGDLDPELQQGILQEVEELDEPVIVQTSAGFHVVELLPPPTFEELRDQIEAFVQQQATEQAVGDFFSQLASETVVVVNPRFGTWRRETGGIDVGGVLGQLQPAEDSADSLGSG